MSIDTDLTREELVGVLESLRRCNALRVVGEYLEAGIGRAQPARYFWRELARWVRDTKPRGKQP